MATLRGLQLLAGRALVDYEFRALLQSDPRAAARQVNVRLTDTDMARLGALNWTKLNRIGDQAGQILPRNAAAWGGLIGPRPIARAVRGAATAAKPKATVAKPKATAAKPKAAPARAATARASTTRAAKAKTPGSRGKRTTKS